MKYYKITNKLEFHNGYQYKNGMNILPDIFNDDENVICGAGGFYFTTAEHIHNFYYLGENVRVIEIPKNKHCKVISTNNIYRSNMIIY